METVKEELLVPKESHDVVRLIEGILLKVKAKAPASEYLELIDEAKDAFDGYDKLGEEVKSAGRADLAAYLVKKVISHL